MAHYLGELTESNMKNLQALVDSNSVIGKEIVTPDGTVILPVSRVSFGFGSGGGDLPSSQKELFGGGTGAGVSIAPIAFLVISGGNVRTIQLVEHVSPVDSAINALPDLVDRISALIKKDKPETPQE